MPNRSAVFVIFTTAYFLSYFSHSADALIAPDLAREMMLDASQLGLMTSLFFATLAAMQLLPGLQLDRLIINLFPVTGHQYSPEVYRTALLGVALGTTLTLLFHLPMRRTAH